MKFVAEVDAALFVLEPLPNMTTEQVSERVGPALDIIRTLHPKTPILLVSNPLLSDNAPQNRALRRVFDTHRRGGDRNLHLLPSRGQLDGRENGTVDGVHPTDLGFERMAKSYEPVLRRLLQN
jgi:lysophospholipase L1-like esterase